MRKVVLFFYRGTIYSFFFWKRFLFDKQQCTGHQNVDSVLMIFFAKNQNWVMKATRRPRVNESDELEEDTRFFFFLRDFSLTNNNAQVTKRLIRCS